MSEAFSMKELLESGVHFGHQVRKWNPKMKKYIYAKRGGIHIIDLQKTVRIANQTYEIIKEMAKQNKKFLFVCTKKQGADSVKEAAMRCNMPYMCKRWPGGLLTNANSIRNSVKKLRRIDRMEVDGSLNKFAKKERISILKEKAKIEGVLGGVKDMDILPDAIIVIDTVREKIALVEALKMGIPSFALLDTNSDPDVVTYGVPANDDAIRTIKLFADKFAQAINEGMAEISAKGDIVVPAIESLNEEPEDVVESNDMTESESLEVVGESIEESSENQESN